MVLCCSGAGIHRYVNGVKKTDGSSENDRTNTVYINKGGHPNEKSDWGAAVIVSWDYDLNHDELIKVSNFLMYGTDAYEESLEFSVQMSSTAQANALDQPTYFSWSLTPTTYVETTCMSRTWIFFLSFFKMTDI